MRIINFVNFADREVLNPLVPLLRQHFSVSDTQLGSLQTVLLIVLAIASIPLGFLADGLSQPKIVGFAALFWSIASLASGIAPASSSCWLLGALSALGRRLTRLRGAMISDSFSYEHRALGQSVFARACSLAVRRDCDGGNSRRALRWQYTVLIVGALGISLASPRSSCQNRPNGRVPSLRGFGNC